MTRFSSLVFFFLFALATVSFASGGDQHGHDHNHDNDHSGHDHSHDHDGEHSEAHGDHETVFNASKTAFHHISDQNVFSIGPVSIPLPTILYAPEKGWSFFSSGKFEPGHHGIGHNAVDGYVLHEGMVRRVVGDFPQGKVHLEHHPFVAKDVEVGGKKKEMIYLNHEGKTYETLPKSTLDGGFLGGGITNFYDFSLTKNVVTMILVFALLAWLFIGVAKSYGRRKGQAPSGVQAFFEPMIEFIRDEVAIPFLGHSWEKYMPFLLSIFFFILGLNLFGQVPFLGNSNVTGNLAFTMVLAIIAFLVTNFSGKKDYWQHIFWMPGVPIFVKPILSVIEILGMFIKPITLMLRLAANITAGHLVIVIFVGLIYIFSSSVDHMNVGYGVGTLVSVPLTIFMMAIELLVAFIQAFVFTILTASYIGAAIEEHHH